MSGWEEQFQQRIDNIRAKEVDQIQKAYTLYAINEALFFSSKSYYTVLIQIVQMISNSANF